VLAGPSWRWTSPGYLDTAPLPAAAIEWKYRAIYRRGDPRFGQWSGEASLSAGE